MGDTLIHAQRTIRQMVSALSFLFISLLGPAGAHTGFRWLGQQAHSSTAFLASPVAMLGRAHHPVQRSLARTPQVARLSMGLNEAAQQCLEEECSIEDVSSLLGELGERQSELQNELTEVTLLMGKLQALSGKGVEISELQSIIRAAFHNFEKTNDNYPALSEPTGYTMTPNRAKGGQWKD